MSKASTAVEPFDPLSVENVGVTLAVELLEQHLHPLPPAQSFPGAGVYALYYGGDHEAYADLRKLDEEAGGWKLPVYIGKAVRENAKQGFSPRSTTQAKLFSRLGNHAASIKTAENLRLEDFKCRFLVLNDAYITLAEAVLITTFRPAWNGMGLGSNPTGGPRMAGKASLWDSLHPGREGRPAGTEERAKEAAAKIATSIAQLSTEPSDPRTARMIEKIKRFLRDNP